MRLELRELVRRMVEEVLDEGSKRDAYIGGIVDALKGSFGEHMKARYAEENAALRRKAGKGTAEGWDKESRERFRFDVVPSLARRLKADKRRAFEEACDEFRELVPHYVRAARAKVADVFQVDERRLVDPPDAAADEFLARVSNAFDQVERGEPVE